MTSAFSFCYGQVDKLPATSSCQILVEGTNLTLVGGLDAVMTTRTEILNLYPTKTQLNIKIPDQDCTILRAECEQIAKDTNTVISITEPIPQSGFVSQNTVNIQITGIPDHTELARVQILVMLDKLAIDTVMIPYKLHHLICGRKRNGIQSILNDTFTSIYFPTPFVFDDNCENLIYITGHQSDIVRAKEMLTKLASQKSQSMYQKDAVLHPRKLDWMLLHCRNDLRKIMRDNGSFIAFPKMGSGHNLVTVYAENRVNAERTLRSLHHLACDIYEACFYFNRDNTIYGVEGVNTFFNSISNISTLVSQLSQISGAEVTYRADPSYIQVFGTERAIRNVYQRLHDMTFLKLFYSNTVFNVELSNDQREFISGKKSGKINKIMKTSGAKIKFVPFSEYNFIIEVESNHFNKALDGLTLLLEELPAEISFYVPEVYHKRIIGVGGKNIQRIMKKYGVYVKFSNAEEFAALGGYYDNDDNVVARTPMKNRVNLENLRHAVMDLINPKDRDNVEKALYDVPFWMHRTLVRGHADYLIEMTNKTSTHLIWPDDELASDVLTLVGPESQVGIAAQMITSIIPEEYHLHLPFSTHLKSVLDSDAYKQLLDRIKADHQIDVELKSTKKPKESNHEGDEIVVLKTTKGNHDNLNTCLESLITFFKNQQVNLYDDGTLLRPTTTTTPAHTYPFPVFDSKILPPSAISSDLVTPTPTSSTSLLNDFSAPLAGINGGLKSYSLFDYPSTTGGLDSTWKNFNPSRTVDNIRAIFDTPEVVKPPSTSSLSLVSPLSFRSGPTSGQNNLDIWSNPPQQVPLNGYVGSPPGIESKQHSMLYGMEQSNTNSNNNGFYQPLKTEFNHAYVIPTSSTSTGSNNSSMHSSQSMPDILDSSPKKSNNLPFQTNYIHTQTSLPPLIYPSSSNNSNAYALSTSMSTPTSTKTAASNMNEFPSLFSLNHSSPDDTVLVQNLLNNMSIGQPNNLTH